MNPILIQAALEQQQQPAPRPVYNPFNEGSRRGLEMSRASLASLPDQSGRSMRSGLLAFADKMSTEPVARGFRNNFGAFGRALSPAIRAYDDSEEEAYQTNLELANNILAHQKAEEAARAQEEERRWYRQHAENQLAETKRYHTEKLQADKAKAGKTGLGVTNPELTQALTAAGFKPIDSKKIKDGYSTTKSKLGSTLKAGEQLKERFENLRKDYEGNTFDNMGILSRFTNPVKHKIAQVTEDPELQQESDDIAVLKSKTNKFVIAAEQALRSGDRNVGQIPKNFIDLAKEMQIFPDFDKDSPTNYKAKLDAYIDQVQEGYKAADLSLKYGVEIDPTNMHDFEQKLKELGLSGEETRAKNAEGQSAPKLLEPFMKNASTPAPLEVDTTQLAPENVPVAPVQPMTQGTPEIVEEQIVEAPVPEDTTALRDQGDMQLRGQGDIQLRDQSNQPTTDQFLNNNVGADTIRVQDPKTGKILTISKSKYPIARKLKWRIVE